MLRNLEGRRHLDFDEGHRLLGARLAQASKVIIVSAGERWWVRRALWKRMLPTLGLPRPPRAHEAERPDDGPDGAERYPWVVVDGHVLGAAQPNEGAPQRGRGEGAQVEGHPRKVEGDLVRGTLKREDGLRKSEDEASMSDDDALMSPKDLLAPVASQR